MKRLLVALFALALLGFAPTVQAAPVTLDLNCLWVSGACTYSSTSYGTITIDDGTNANWVTVKVDMVSSLDKVYNVYLNWTGTLQSGYEWYLSDGSGSSVNFTANANGPDGKLDINVDTGTTPVEPWSGILEIRKCSGFEYGGNCYAGSWGYQNLDPSQFNTKDVNGYYAFAVVHTGSETYGAEDYTPPPPPPPSQVPEPASLTLLGTGLFGLATAVRRRLQK